MTLRRRALLAGAGAAALAGCGPAREIAGDFNGTAVERGHALRDVRGWPPATVARRAQVLVAGGGIAGLAAARALRQRGVDDFAVLEMEDHAGGNSRAGSVNGIACPLGAHYLPVPGDDAHEVQDLLEELGLRRRVAGRWVYDERTLCHSPQERLYFQGAWQEGLLPWLGVGAATLAAYRRFAARVEALRREARFAMPALRAPVLPLHLALDAQTFDAWLAAEGFADPQLRWYLDYCCRDDYGAGSACVSAWAGIHYFASRHGFHVPGGSGAQEGDDPEAGLLTWPEGNGWLARRLAAPCGARIATGRTVLRIAETRAGVEVDAWDHATQQTERWRAGHCIVALPVFVAARVVQPAPDFLRAAAARTPHAAWAVANIRLDAPLADRAGAAPAWDNVLHGAPGLGYVDARHQSLDPRPGPTVLTWYQALGTAPEARRMLLERPWGAWRDAILAELAAPHPDIAERATRIEVTRYGHAMAVPVPGQLAFLNEIGPQRLNDKRWQLLKNEQSVPVPGTAHLSFAHADWAGYSVFEEAFTRGHAAGLAA
ncbi:FAD-dependent oxidoreductase [Ramlibacter sp. H39-3-26]|nr:FAD-dependent oxidoreductase [Ramlibacter sp. H39-3-26]MDF1485579.1 FAD-dependent oxidoreductase [Ramlibacter sp. H39-3-26]